MSEDFKEPGCFRFVDYINICSIQVVGEIICMDGVYNDPISGNVVPSYFEAKFDFFYSLLNDMEFINNADKGIEALSASLAGGGKDGVVDLEEGCIVELHTMVIRLSVLLEEVVAGEIEQSGLFIEDARAMGKGHISFDSYLNPPAVPEEEMQTKAWIERSFRIMSGYLVVLALRYEYYLCIADEDRLEEDVLFLSSLEDEEVFEMARAANRLINGMKNEYLV